MSLHPNSAKLVTHLEALPLLAGRYRQLRLVNHRATGKRGSFSLVFRAEDIALGRAVAIKFFDIDPRWWTDQYRRQAFLRENEILVGLMGVQRCLQLVQVMQQYDYQLRLHDGSTHSIICEYFVTDWLEVELDDYFYTPKFGDEEKLLLFNEIVLAVEALHAREVSHRDLKPDNLRRDLDQLKEKVVAIDLGTAARADSGCIAIAYGRPPGAIPYAAPESVAGLAGSRVFSPYTDAFALGCLLFELFHHQLCTIEIRRLNPGLPYTLRTMFAAIPVNATDSEAQRVWDSMLDTLAKGFTPIRAGGGGSFIPPGLAPLVSDVISSLTHLDYRRRMPLAEVRRKVWSAVRLVRNNKAYQRHLAVLRQRRSNRLSKLKLIDARYGRAGRLLGGGNASG